MAKREKKENDPKAITVLHDFKVKVEHAGEISEEMREDSEIGMALRVIHTDKEFVYYQWGTIRPVQRKLMKRLEEKYDSIIRT